MWNKLDDKAWSNGKLRRCSRAARGLFWDMVSHAGDKQTDGYLGAVESLPLLQTGADDPDLKVLVREGLLHKRGDTCRCIDTAAFVWPRGKGYLIHDFLKYNPSAEENEVKKAQTAELRDPALRAFCRGRDFGRCRYCGDLTNPNDRRGPKGESLDHINPEIAAREHNLVIACRGCNSAKKKRTPEHALMTLLDVDDVRALHYKALGIPDPDAPHTNPTRIAKSDPSPGQVPQAGAPGRVGYGSGGVGSGQVGSGQDGTGQVALPGQIGPPSTPRTSSSPNPHLRAAHGDPELEPPPPTPDRARASPPTAQRTQPRQQQPRRRKRKGRR